MTSIRYTIVALHFAPFISLFVLSGYIVLHSEYTKLEDKTTERLPLSLPPAETLTHADIQTLKVADWAIQKHLKYSPGLQVKNHVRDVQRVWR